MKANKITLKTKYTISVERVVASYQPVYGELNTSVSFVTQA